MSHMFDAADNAATDFCPIDGCVHFFVHQAADGHVFSANEVESMFDFLRWFLIVILPNDPLYSVLENQVCELIA